MGHYSKILLFSHEISYMYTGRFVLSYSDCDNVTNEEDNPLHFSFLPSCMTEQGACVVKLILALALTLAWALVSHFKVLRLFGL